MIFSNTSQFYSSDGFFILLTLTATVIILYIFHKLNSISGIPPGPWGIPIFGYLPFLSNQPYKDFSQISKKYGSLFSLQLGSRIVIVLNSYDLIKKAFKNEVFTGRPHHGLENEFYGNGVVTADGELWREQRRVILGVMKNLGLGKHHIQDFIAQECETAVKTLQATKGEPYDIKNITEDIAFNTVAYFIFGQRFSLKTTDLKDALNAITKVGNTVDIVSAMNSFPAILYYIPASISGVKQLRNTKKTITNFVNQITAEHEKTFDSTHIRDLIDEYLKKVCESENKETNMQCELLRDNVTSIFFAGTHTSNNMMSWCFKLLAAHPNVQREVQAEMDRVIGRERLPHFQDLQNLPYTEAFFLETYRYISLVPLGLYHRITEEVTFHGYRIPKNSCVLGNIWDIHNNADLWTEPDKFDPCRFLDNNGKLIPERCQHVIPFSIGKRNCVGEPLARREIFLVVTHLLHHFTFSLPKGEIWKFKPDVFMTGIVCHKHYVRAIPRN